jgi:hypothetical protein
MRTTGRRVCARSTGPGHLRGPRDTLAQTHSCAARLQGVGAMSLAPFAQLLTAATRIGGGSQPVGDSCLEACAVTSVA